MHPGDYHPKQDRDLFCPTAIKASHMCHLEFSSSHMRKSKIQVKLILILYFEPSVFKTLLFQQKINVEIIIRDFTLFW